MVADSHSVISQLLHYSKLRGRTIEGQPGERSTTQEIAGVKKNDRFIILTFVMPDFVHGGS